MSGSKIDSLDVDDREGIALLDSQNEDTQMIEGTKKIRSERISINAIRLLSESICKRNVLIGFLRSRRQTERKTHEIRWHTFPAEWDRSVLHDRTVGVGISVLAIGLA